jgi:hypothetical protein
MRNTEALLDASRVFGLEVNTEDMVVSVHQNEVRNHNLLIYNKSFQNVANSRT